MILGWRCRVCATTVELTAAEPWRCPNATRDDPRHVLHVLEHGDPAPARDGATNPFVRYGERLAWWAAARARGLTDEACEALTHEVAGGFTITPFERSDHLSTALGRDVWVKDETGNVAGSHKGRHLATILLHLRIGEHDDARGGERGDATTRRLAIASCGNAAIAAATLARTAGRDLDVYVPDWIDAAVDSALHEHGATVHRCERLPGDPPGDPTVHRFRDAVAVGAVPFSVQGPENALCLDGGRTIGWELAEQAADANVTGAATYVQVGGGALAGCLGAGVGDQFPLRTVQASGAAPLAAALARAARFEHPERHWADVMQPWPEPQSLADGIIDDETYDWIAVGDALHASAGKALVVPEWAIAEAHALATAAGYPVSPTGSAGLAGPLVEPGSTPVIVVMSGVSRR